MRKLLIFAIASLALVLFAGCDVQPVAAPVAASGVTEITAEVTVGSDGLSVEQRNVRNRLLSDNEPGSIKHLYIISAFSGDVIIYSTVDGKVTSSGKRLSNTVSLQRGDRGEWSGDFVMPSIQDDGTYGSSIPYLYWWDAQGRYHQHYVSGGQITHISDQPVATGDVRISMGVVQGEQ
jgi:hypothetical protein